MTTRTVPTGPAAAVTGTEAVMTAIKDLIVERGLREGDVIPTEPELVAALGVGRNSLREALRALQSTGVVQIRHGQGTFVGSLTLRSAAEELLFHSRISPLDPNAYLRQLIEVRAALEQGLISNLIAQGLTPDIERLTDILARMDREVSAGSLDPRTDQEFHEVLYEPLNNPVATMIMRVFWRVFGELVTEVENDPVTAQQTADRHHTLLLAVRARDARGARIAMHNHFAGLRSRLGMVERGSGGSSKTIEAPVGTAAAGE